MRCFFIAALLYLESTESYGPESFIELIEDTSGLLVVAKNDIAHQFLASQIKAHSFTREYEAVVYGNLKTAGTVHAPIGRNPIDRKKMAVIQRNSRDAVTHYNIVCHYNGFTHIRVCLETGRTHQIRVHMAYIRAPCRRRPGLWT